MLEVEGLEVSYGHVRAVRDVSFEVKEGEFAVFLGRNGAGKTSLLKALLGQVKARGRITLRGRRLEGLPPWRRVKLGLSLVPEGRQVFSPLTVRENLELGAFVAPGKLKRNLAQVFSLFPVLEEKAGLPAGALSGGEQQMLAIGRALMAEPALLLLDEPSMGLAPKVVQEIYATLKKLKGRLTVLLVEQNVKKALSLADRVFLLESGRLVSSWGRDEVDETVVEAAYLGGSEL